MGNNHEQAPKQQIDETEKNCCDLENTLTIENYKYNNKKGFARWKSHHERNPIGTKQL